MTNDRRTDSQPGFVLMCLLLPLVAAGAVLGQCWWQAILLAVLGVVLWVIGLIVWIVSNRGNGNDE